MSYRGDRDPSAVQAVETEYRRRMAIPTLQLGLVLRQAQSSRWLRFTQWFSEAKARVSYNAALGVHGAMKRIYKASHTASLWGAGALTVTGILSFIALFGAKHTPGLIEMAQSQDELLTYLRYILYFNAPGLAGVALLGANRAIEKHELLPYTTVLHRYDYGSDPRFQQSPSLQRLAAEAQVAASALQRGDERIQEFEKKISDYEGYLAEQNDGEAVAALTPLIRTRVDASLAEEGCEDDLTAQDEVNRGRKFL
jgi:hypothetical protein